MNPDIRIFLVRLRKISLPDRIERGLWPHPLLLSNPGPAPAYNVNGALHLLGDLDSGRVFE